MAKFCVAYVNFFDNELVQKVVEAETWLDALYTAANTQYTPEMFDDIPPSADMEQYKNRAYDCDQIFSVIELS